MCGIAGAWGEVDATQVTAMTRALAHRGPDDSGYHSRGPVRLGARRLSIIDIAGGAQPMYNENGEICVVANGEIYNHVELRRRLQAMGHRFTTRCDTEVIVHLYEEYGDRCVDHLRGMFAFAVADGQRLLLARDRLGIKPLYYTRVGAALLFASEIKALLRCPQVDPALDLQAFADSRLLGHATGDRTHVEGVRSLLPGHTMTVTAGPRGPEYTTSAYYRLPTEPDEGITFEAARDALVDLLREAVRSHLVADVEVGLTLSGGLDSTVLALLAREEVARPVRVYSVGDRPDHPDLVQSARLADMFGWPRHAAVMSFEDYLATLPGYVLAHEVPGRLGGVPLFFLCARIGAELKVCLNGEGADELFGGYPEYVDRGFRARAVLNRLGGIRSLGVAPSPRALELIDGMTNERPFADYLDRLLATNMTDQLVRQHLELIDKFSMAASLEMRVPFMDHRVAEFVAGLPVGFKVDTTLMSQKHLLRHATLRAWGGDGPVVDTVLRRKIGAPSAGSQHMARLADLCERELPADYITRHELGCCFSSKHDLLMHEMYCELFLRRRAAKQDDFSVLEFIQEQAGAAVPVSS
jgi:asparagine synthase (glutamine-hydrolysing)